MIDVEPYFKDDPKPKAPRKPLGRGKVRLRRGRDGAMTAARARQRKWCFDRANGRCEVKADPGCSGRAEQAHHIHRRSQGGSDGLENLLAVCGICHGYIHNHPEESYMRGWLKRSAS